MGIASRIFTAGSKHPLKPYERAVKRINALEPEYESMSDEQIVQRSNELHKKALNGEDAEYVSDNAMALLREHIKRLDGRRAYDVQLMAALALWDGDVIEASTGSGKTLISHFASYLAALYGKQTHVVTVNEYLSQRDADEDKDIMGPLGFTVGRIYNQQPNLLKKEAYTADVVYGTPSEFGFDYLRDNMVARLDDKVQRAHDYVIIDEVDSILIDEARTPLIISGASTKPLLTYTKFASAVRGLSPYDEDTDTGDYVIDESKKTIAATDAGLDKIEKRLGFKIFDDSTGQKANHLMQAMKAEYLFHNGKDYVIIDGKVKIVDEHTGRIMEGRQWSEGLHQAIEAKEGVQITDENVTFATCTLQNYFRMYSKISGMTGTGLTVATEFKETYGVDTVGIPDNKPCIREDQTDTVYANIDAKFNAIANEIEKAHEAGQPVLAGTASVESSERLSKLLDRRHIPHTVLNAKHHAREAAIVAQAGRLGAVTVATNMAGRGTDIKLGGDVPGMAREIAESLAAERWNGLSAAEKRELGVAGKQPTDTELKTARAQAQAICDKERPLVVAAGGLYVIGTERHESRRIDDQLRGRAGRQGDPGKSHFFISLDDDLLRLFGNLDHVRAMMEKADMDENDPIDFKIVSKAIESAQHKIEQIHYEQRKNTLEYDDVINKQRKLIYAERDAVLRGEDLGAKSADIIYDEVSEAMDEYASSGKSNKWDNEGLRTWWLELTGKREGRDIPVVDGKNIAYDFDAPVTRKEQEPKIRDFLNNLYKSKLDYVASFAGAKAKKEDVWNAFQNAVMLKTIDNNWQKHLSAMEYLRTGIGLRGIGQRDPKVEYKHDAKVAFDILVDQMYHEFLRAILCVNSTIYQSQAQRTAAPSYRYTQPMDPDADAADNTHNPSRHMPITNGQAQPVVPIRGMGNPLTAGLVGSRPKTYRKDEDTNPYANVGRNDPCPCGSGKKFKNCHGRYAR